MANTKSVFELKIEAAEAANTTRDLRTALKGLVDEQANVAAGSKEWKKLTNAINETEGKIGELNDSFQSLKGSGIDRVTSSTGLLREGFEKFDTGKIKLGLQGVGAAFKSIPIFLIVEGVMKLIESFDELKESGGIIGTVFTAIGDAIKGTIKILTDFTDLIGITAVAQTKASEAMLKETKKQQEAIGSRYDFEIAKAAAAGESTLELEKKKGEAVRANIKMQIEQLAMLSLINGKWSKEQLEQLEELKVAYRTSLQENQLATIKDDKVKKDTALANAKEADAKRKEQAAKDKAEKDKALADSIKEANEAWNQEIKNADEIKKQNDDNAAKELAALEQQKKDEQAIKDFWAKKVADDAAAEIALAEAVAARKFKIATDSFGAAQGLSDTVFAITQSQAKEGTEAYEKNAKKQFEINKALQLGGAIINGYKAITTSLASAPVAIGAVPNPAGIASLAFAVLQTTASIAKIATSQYKSTASSASSVSAPSVGIPNAPTTGNNTPNLPRTNSTEFDEQGRNLSVRAYVVETDGRKVTDRINKINQQAEY